MFRENSEFFSSVMSVWRKSKGSGLLLAAANLIEIRGKPLALHASHQGWMDWFAPERDRRRAIKCAYGRILHNDACIHSCLHTMSTIHPASKSTHDGCSII